jgi:hypothetical protein
MKHTYIPRSMKLCAWPRTIDALWGARVLGLGTDAGSYARQATGQLQSQLVKDPVKKHPYLWIDLDIAACDSHTDTSAPDHQQLSCSTAPAVLGLERTPCTNKLYQRYSRSSLLGSCDTLPNHSLGKEEARGHVLGTPMRRTRSTCPSAHTLVDGPFIE